MEITINGFTFSEEKADKRRTENKEKYKAKLNFLLVEKENIYNKFVPKIKEALKPINGLYERIKFVDFIDCLRVYLTFNKKEDMVVRFYFDLLGHLNEVYITPAPSNVDFIEVQKAFNNSTIKEATEKYFQKLKEIEKLEQNWRRYKKIA